MEFLLLSKSLKYLNESLSRTQGQTDNKVLQFGRRLTNAETEIEEKLSNLSDEIGKSTTAEFENNSQKITLIF